jgi:hypothetical protein
MATIKGDDGTPSGFSPNEPFGVWGDSGTSGPFGGGGNGVVGSSGFSSGVAGFTLSSQLNAAGVFGEGPVGVAGYVAGARSFPQGPVGVYGSGSSGNPRSALGAIGVLGDSDTRAGVAGQSVSGVGVAGESQSDAGVAGLTTSSAGVRGVSANNVGVVGISNGTGIIGWGGAQAGFFFGDVQVTGQLFKGGGGFMIDHPKDPAGRFLRHSFVESPDMKNVYDGVANCNSKGEAIVRLPDWFEALNSDYRYQLTPLGAPAPDLHVAAEVKKGCFTIRGGAKGLRVSWQVTGVRQDAWAKSNRIVVDEKKTAKQRGKFLHAEAHGAAARRGIHHGLEEEARKYLAPKSKSARKAKPLLRGGRRR